MAERLSREQLYDLVWSEPMKTLSSRFGISDVALKKTCARADIPSPDRGYWAKRDAGKETVRAPLPPRAPGMADEVVVAAGKSYWYQSWDSRDLLGPLPPPPEFPESLEVVRQRIAKIIGAVSVPQKARNWHPALERLLREDEKRREQQSQDPYPLSWNAPRFDSPLERRRFRLLNSLFFATAKLRGNPSIDGREARDVQIVFHQQRVRIDLDRPKRAHRREHISETAPQSHDTELCLSILAGNGSETAQDTWQDRDGSKLEAQMAEIAIKVVLTAEIQYREGAVRQYEWRVKRKAELEEEERQRKLEAERAERERQKQIEQARVDRLIHDASAFRRAADIREYVRAVRAVVDGMTYSPDQVERWSRWALAEADRIDPTVNGAFISAMRDKAGGTT